MEQIIAAAAVNDDLVLSNCLSRSPDVAAGELPLSTYRGFRSAAMAYNQALADAPAGATVVLLHQDVYLPAGWTAMLRREMLRVRDIDPDWAVLGLVGIDMTGRVRGHVWSTGLARLIGGPGDDIRQAQCLDELLLVVRNDGSMRFDENVPGFHLYGTDIIWNAESQGRHSYIVDAPVIHHDKIIKGLDASYRRAWDYTRRKWRDKLPIRTLIIDLSRFGIWFDIANAKLRWRRRHLGDRVAPNSDPREIAIRLGLESQCDAEVGSRI